MIRRLPELKAVVRYGIGVDTVDLAECTRRGICVANVPDYCIDEVATHALTLTLNWARKLPIAQQTNKNGQWDIAALRPLQSPQDQVLGLLGFGRIAQALCRMSRAIGFQVWASDPYVEKSRIQKRGAKPVSLKQSGPRRRLYFASSAAYPKDAAHHRCNDIAGHETDSISGEHGERRARR